MARPRTATNVLELRGAFKKNPARGRERAHEPKPLGGIGPAPKLEILTFEAAWDLIVATAPPGVLTSRDRLYVRVTAELLALLSEKGAAGVDSAKLTRLEMMLSKLGLNPADASRVKAWSNAPPGGSADNTTNPFDDL